MATVQAQRVTGYRGRLRRAGRTILRLAREGKVLDAARMLFAGICSASTSLLFERRAGSGAAPDSRQLVVRRVAGDQASEFMKDLCRAGAGPDLDYFESGAVAYLAYEAGAAAGVGWRMASSPLLRRIGEPANSVYVGGFHVVPEARGRGIYPALLNAICRDLPSPDALVFAQTSLSNLASQRGLVKAGFCCRGKLRVLVVMGVIVWCSIGKAPAVACF